MTSVASQLDEPGTERLAAAAERMSIVVAGHVDHGKSTVVGRLLADTGSFPDGKVAQVRAHCARHARPFEYAFLLDALKDEQAQGITIDAARIFFRTVRRHYVVIDAPGHVEFLKNMVTGASRADAALLVIDAREGVRENSRRHGYLTALLGVRQVAVLINKMDLVDRREDAFDRIVAEYSAFLSGLDVRPTAFIPIVAREGENLAERSAEIPWYHGPTVLEALDAFVAEPPPVGQPFRMPVQGVYKFTAEGDDRRIVAGTVETGTLRPGDEVVFRPSGKRSRVRTIEAFNAEPPEAAYAGQATGFTLEEQVYVGRGEMVVRTDEPGPAVAERIAASIFWLGREPLRAGRDYVLKLGTARVPVRVESVTRSIDAADLSPRPGADRVERHEVADCVLRLRRPIALDTVAEQSATSRFVLVDDFDIRGGGIVRQVLSDAAPAAPTPAAPLRPSFGPAIEPAVVWLTGLSGAGKSTIAERLVTQLRDRGLAVEHLDGDAVRDVFPATGFTREDRDAHVRRIGYMASRLEHHGVIVVASFISPYAASRDFARTLCRRFVEVHVATPADECERRDVKGLYARARRGELRQLTGVDDPYEPPTRPELVLDTRYDAVEACCRRIIDLLRTGENGASHGPA